tara:strand:+ start:135 stop:455 length:321 start_codon:yes stop_codon:yes gene_type:complete
MAKWTLYSEEVTGEANTEIFAAPGDGTELLFHYLRIEQRGSTIATVDIKQDVTTVTSSYLTATTGMLDERKFGEQGLQWGNNNGLFTQAAGDTTYLVEAQYRTIPS